MKPDSRPPALRLYMIARAEDAGLGNQLKRLEEVWLIEPATSPYGAGERVAQLYLERVSTQPMRVVHELPESEPVETGFDS